MSKKQLIYLILSMLSVACFAWLGFIELRAEEPRRAIVSLEMLLSDNWIVPQINGTSYYNKPPFFNWVMAAVFKITGSYSEWAVRLPSMLSLILLAWINYKIVSKYINLEVGILSSLFFLTSGDILFYGSVNTGEIDPFYSLVVYLQAISIFLGFYHNKSFSLFIGSYFFVAVGFLTKGMPSLAFQACTLLVCALYYRKFRLLLSWQHLLGIILLTLLCGSYFYLFQKEDDAVAFLVRQFKEASQRTGLETKFSDTLIQFFTFPLQLLKLMLPWSLMLIFFFSKGFFRSLFQNELIAFSVIFFASNIWLYWISGDFKARYYYMFLPFVSLWFAYYFLRNKELMPKAYEILFGFFTTVAWIFPLLFIVPLFIPQTAVLPGIGLRVGVMIFLGGLTSLIYFKGPSKMYAAVLLMAVARIGMNVFYLPALQADSESMNYRSDMNELLKITGDEQVFLFGEPYVFLSDASLGPITFKEVHLITAPIHAYQVPYYISRANKKVVQFTSELVPGRYYIARADNPEIKTYPVLFRYADRFIKREWVLIRT